jgi:hypothetical protein
MAGNIQVFVSARLYLPELKLLTSESLAMKKQSKSLAMASKVILTTPKKMEKL